MTPLQFDKHTLICAFAVVILALPSLARERDFTLAYSVTELGTLPGYSTEVAQDVNNQGSAVGTALGPIYNRAILIHRERVIDIAPTARAGEANAINAEGSVVGESYNGTIWAAFLYSHGTLKSFAPLDAIQTSAECLNDVGQVAGYFSPPNVPLNSNDHIYIRQADGTFSDLGAFGVDPYAAAINNQGRVLIGTYDEPRGHTYLSRPGSLALEEVPSLIPNGWVSPGDMNESGMVVGQAAVDGLNQRQHAYVYFEGKIKDLGVLPNGDTTSGNGINNFGQMVGAAHQFAKPILDAKGNTIGYTPEIDHGWVYLDGKMFDLNGLLKKSATGWEITEAISINDRGEILADAVFQGGETKQVLLKPHDFLP